MRNSLTRITGQEGKIHTPATVVATPNEPQTQSQPRFARSTALNHSGPQAGHSLDLPGKAGNGTRNKFVKVRLSQSEYDDGYSPFLKR